MKNSIDPNRTEKWCPGCARMVTIEYFYKNRSATDGHAHYCKSCSRDQKKIDRENNPEKYVAKNKARTSEQHRRYGRTKYERHSDRIIAYHSRRQAHKARLPATLTAEQWNTIRDAFNGQCAYCDCNGTLQQDHIIPIVSDGGYVMENIIPACRSCNCGKGSKNMRQWIKDEDRYVFIMDTVSSVCG